MQVCFKVNAEDVEKLKKAAAEQRRPVAWIARESMRKGLNE